MIKSQKRLSEFTLGALLMGCLSAHAQSLPAVQQHSLRAPAGIKIDGKTTEWSNRFQAYNKATGIYYTMANDSTNLYLAIQAKNPVIVRKILGGSMVFTVNGSVKKGNKQVAFTFPLLSSSVSAGIGIYLKQRIGLTPAKTKNIYGRDSLLLLINTTLINNLKQIRVKGVKAFADTTLSVYNDLGIKVRALFDTNNALTCELAIPLKYLKLPGTMPARFNYQIKLNELYANTAKFGGAYTLVGK